MQIPTHVTFRQLEHSPALEAKIRTLTEKLEQFSGDIIRCDTAVEKVQRRHHQGNIFYVRVRITVHGDEIVVSKVSDDQQAHEDAYVTVRDAFDAAKRQLEEHVRRNDQRAKVHEAPPHGRISQLVPMEDYGRIITSDGRDIYFHRNSLLNADFDKLEIGMEVRFAEEEGDDGPQASSLRLIGKHHFPE